MTPIAVVGMDCRFPGAADPDAFFDMLIRGGDGIGPVPQQRWRAEDFYAADGRAGTTNTRFGGFLADQDAFDHEFFGISPREAAAMDPQHRLVLQTAWRALEDAGLPPTSLAGSRTSVHVGIMSGEWAALQLSDFRKMTAQGGSGNGYYMAANRISYHLDLRGPSVAVDTACSSSLVAVHLAAMALRSGECDLAIAGGVNLVLTPALSIFYTQSGLSAPDGRCKPFSADADGIGRCEGVGLVVLRRLDEALADNQMIYALIEGSAVNSNGRSNGITAPNRWAQRDVLAQAYHRAGVDPADITFVEAHGTGTRLGDMIEVRALGELHGADRARPCALGSVKGNLSHAEGAAGIAGLIKACLALDRRVLPSSLLSAPENPELRLADAGLELARSAIRLPRGTVRAGVSSFGLGGANAHVALCCAPAVRRPARRSGTGVLTVSANNRAGLRRNVALISEALGRAPEERLTQFCHATNQVKSTLRYRLAVAVDSRDQLLNYLREMLANDAALDRAARRDAGPPQVALLFTGQGAQYPGMTQALQAACLPYRRRLDEVDTAMRPHLGRSIRSVLCDGGEELHRTELTQPALFAVEYALGATLLDLGVAPIAMVGHSVGEFAAACLAGVLTLEDACRLVVGRGGLLQALPERGGMLAVHAGARDIEALLEPERRVGIAAVNGPRSVVISGEDSAVHRIAAGLAEAGVHSTPLTVSHAFHSPLVVSVAEPLRALAAGVAARAPAIPIASTVRGRFIHGAEMDAGYWAEQVCQPVLFSAALEAVISRGPTHLVEVGPRSVLLSLARQIPAALRLELLAPCPGPAATGRELAEVLAVLHRDGLVPRWAELYGPQEREPLRLPGYAFDPGPRFWTSAHPSTAATSALAPENAAGAATREAAAELAGAGRGNGSAFARQVLATVAAVGGYHVGDLHPTAKLQEDLGYDSIMVVQLTDRLRDLLGLEQPLLAADLLENIATVEDLLSFILDRYQPTPGKGAT
ncbi:MAG TPA: beta-ketoacyl synthase N-terminal-like domain-containing protein [Pseudonocardiaceae bacterium]